MVKIELRVDIRNGKLVYDPQELKDKASLLDDGRAIMTVELVKYETEIPDLSRHYYALRDKIYEEGSTGYTKAEIHNLIKDYVFRNMPLEERYFDFSGVETEELTDRKKWSTKWLTADGWVQFIKHTKAFCWENFNVYL